MIAQYEALPICPSCHGETPRLTYCTHSHRLLCGDCALTDADLFFLELVQRDEARELVA